MPELPQGLPTTPQGLRGNANVNDELEGAGVAFGDLIKTVGESVAVAQRELNSTGAASATALAETLVDVIAVQETVYDDSGNVQDGKIHTRQLPLINFIDPPFYEWSRVRVQGLFHASEFASSASNETSVSSTSLNLRSRGAFFGPFAFARGSAGISNVSSSTTTEVERLEDRSVGFMRVRSQLVPRRDTSVPKPRQVLRGPRLILVEGEIKNPDPQTRTLGLTIQYQKRDGSPIQGKAISFETEGVSWEFDTAGSSQTDANGQLNVTLKRTFLDEEVDRTPIDVIVTARIGLISNSISVQF